MNNKDSLYDKALNYYKNKDFVNARKYLLASNEPNHEKDILNMLSIIETSSSNYLKSREILEENRELLYPEHAENYCILDMKEYNYNRALGAILDSFSNPKIQPTKLIYLADLYLQLGEYDIARKMYETLLNKSDYYVDATLKLIYLSIIVKNYSYANKLFKNLKENEIGKNLYIRLNYILEYFNNKLRYTRYSQYYVKRLLKDDDNDLINHVQKHIGENSSDNGSYFFSDININRLIFEVRNKIDNLNPKYDEDSYDYKFIFQNPIGYNSGVLTNAFKVITAIGTNRIITMYPILISKEFNLEGNLEDKKLLLKRKRGK